jgi:hypothetical protein
LTTNNNNNNNKKEVEKLKINCTKKIEENSRVPI